MKTSPIRCELDHLVVGAQTLNEGASYIADLLGVFPVMGGVHPNMGTHNVLLSLGGSVYLEVIAINPDGDPPEHPRWFSLDNPAVRQTLKDGPQLLTWVARTPDISGLKRLEPYAACDVREMSRGDLRWLFAFTPDGECPGDGLLPHVIEWRGKAHPTDTLPDSQCRFKGLRANLAPGGSTGATIAAMGLNPIFSGSASEDDAVGLHAVIETPRGEILL